MPFKHVGKAVFTASAILCGAVYIICHYAFGANLDASYRAPQFLAMVYILYLPLVTPFDTESAFARIRNTNYIEYTLDFLMGLTGIAAMFWLAVTAEVWLIGHFALHDNLSFNVAIDSVIHFFINLNILNILHTVLCRWLRNSSARKVIIFSVPLIQMAAHYFGSDEIRRFVFMCYGTFEQPMPYIIGVYTVVFAIFIFFMLKKTRREYV